MEPQKKPLFNVVQLATRMESQTAHTYAEWEQVLSRALLGFRGQDLDYVGLERIVLACGNPSQFAVMVRLMSQYCRASGGGREVYKMIDEHIEPTTFVLSEWVQALEFFANWLDKRKKAIDFQNMLNYIACCTELGNAKQPGANLTDIVRQSIDEYGVDWAK